MEEIIYDAGFLLTMALDNLDKNKFTHPIYGAIKEDGAKIFKEIKEVSLELSIPKAVSMFEKNQQNAKQGVLIYPAELEDEDKKRVQVIIVYIQNYTNNEYMILSQPYSFKNGKISPTNYELLDYYDFLEDRLEELEEIFVSGAFGYDNFEYIWEERFVANK